MKSKKKPKNNDSLHGLLTVLYRDEEVPLLDINPSDMSNIAKEFTFEDYYCPFNTTFPLTEFDKTEHIFKHLDKQVGGDVGDETVLVAPPRQIKAQDILLATYKNPSRRTIFFLIPQLNKEDWKKAAISCRDNKSLTLFPRPVGDRFYAITLHGEIRGQDLIPDLIETYRPDNY